MNTIALKSLERSLTAYLSGTRGDPDELHAQLVDMVLSIRRELAERDAVAQIAKRIEHQLNGQPILVADAVRLAGLAEDPHGRVARALEYLNYEPCRISAYPGFRRRRV